jgi:hypothetical protein
LREREQAPWETEYLINFESYTDFDGSLGGKITGFEVKEKALIVWLGWQLACFDKVS